MHGWEGCENTKRGVVVSEESTRQTYEKAFNTVSEKFVHQCLSLPASQRLSQNRLGQKYRQQKCFVPSRSSRISPSFSKKDGPEKHLEWLREFGSTKDLIRVKTSRKFTFLRFRVLSTVHCRSETF